MSHGIKITDLTSAVALDGTEALPIVQGGTTVKATTAQITTLAQTAMPAANITGTLPVAHGGTGVTTSTGSGNTVLSTSPTLVTPALGTPASGVLTNATGLPVSTGISGLGTGVATFLATPSSANLAAAVTNETGSGALVFATSPTLVTPVLGTVAAGSVLTNATGLPLTTGVTGTLPAANGGTAQSTYATGDTLYASALNTVSKLTIGSTGQVLTVAGGVPTWATLSTSAVTTFSAGTTGFTPSTATSGAITLAGTLAVTNGGTGVAVSTGTVAVVLSNSPVLVTPNLGTPSAAVLTNATGLPLTTGVTGTLPIANGGTGQTTANTAFNALAPSQISQSSKFLTTDGTNTSWASPVAAAASVTIGTTTVISGTSGYILYNNAGSLGNLATTGTGSVVLSASPTLTGTLSGAAASFTGNMGSQTLTVNHGATASTSTVALTNTGALGINIAMTGDGATTPTKYLRVSNGVLQFINSAYSASLWVLTDAGNMSVAGTSSFNGATTMGNALTYGGVTLSNSVTGTGSMVLSASPTFTGTLTAATATYSGAVTANANMVVKSQLQVIGNSSANMIFIRYVSGNRIDSYNNPITAATPLLINSSATTFSIDGVSGSALVINSAANVSIAQSLIYGGVTLAASVTGTGSMVLSASPTFTGTPKFAGATSGTIGLVATAVAGTNTLTLPAETGTLRSTVSSGTVLQVVNYQTGALASGTTTMPTDDTIPQNTEGTEFMTLAITPRSATSKLRIDVVLFGSPNASAWVNVALFQDSTANALAATELFFTDANAAGPICFTHYMTSGTTSSTTFKVRAGMGTGGTTSFNGTSPGPTRRFGGVNASSITITEVVP